MPIRPSALTLAEKCGHASRLAERYPEGSVATERGSEMHARIAEALKTGSHAPLGNDGALIAAALWAMEHPSRDRARPVEAEVFVRLEDPETGDIITQGTTDAIVFAPDGGIVVIDWKSGQPQFVTPADDNLQLAAYACALALVHDAPWVMWSLYFVDHQRADESQIVKAADLWPWIDRIKVAASKGDVPVTGPHCEGCWQRKYCRAWTMPAVEGEAALAPLVQPGELTTEKVAEGLRLIKALREICDLAETRARDFVLANGGRLRDGSQVYERQEVAGRKSGPSVAELEAQGLGHMVKQGAPSTRWGWRKLRASEA